VGRIVSEQIVHIVLFSADNAQDAEAAARALAGMASLDTVETLTVERNLGLHPPAYDLMLLTTHRDAEQLRRFRDDPGHRSVVETIADLVPRRATVDLAVTDSLASSLHTIKPAGGASHPAAHSEQNGDN